MNMHNVFPFNRAKAAQIVPAEAARLVSLFRFEGEHTFLQTFADGPDELYWLDPWKDQQGQQRHTQKYTLAKAERKGLTNGRTATGGSFSLEQLAAGQYTGPNLARVGVFWTVNVLRIGATRRTADQVERIAAVFVDLDGTPLPSDGFHLPPTALVESSLGKFHAYWAVVDLPLDDFPTTQKHIADLYNGDSAVHDLSRVMRLPGYWHGKQEEGFLTRLLETRPEAQYSRVDLLAGFPDLDVALATAEAEREQWHRDAERHRSEADQIRQEAVSSEASDRAGARRKYAQVALLGGVADILSAGEGTRNTTLNAVAYRQGRIVGAGLADEVEVRAALFAVAERVGLEQYEIERTINSGLTAGKAEPIDSSKIAQFAGGKRATQEKPSGNLRQAAERVEVKLEALPGAEHIPEPEGEGGNYSDQQIRELLSIVWPVVAVITDKAHAYRLRELAGEDLGYVAELGGYVAWDGHQWLSGGKDGAGQVEARRRVQGLGVAMRPEVERLLSLYSRLDLAAKQLVREHGLDARDAKVMQRKADAMARAYYAHARAARATEADGKQQAILSSARTLYMMDVALFEPRPWLVGFQNGTWDRGEFRPARREDHLLTLAAVEYRLDAPHADWLEVLDRITGGSAELAHTLQDVAGYALSGASSLRLLPWLYGEAGTGKSTFSELLATVLGDMAATVDPKLFAADAARERLGAAIWGKRVALCAEAGNARLDAEALKTLSGGDRLSVRMLYSEGFTARASHVLLMVANDAPRVEAYDDALKDRVLAIPFAHLLRDGPPLLGGRRLEELRLDVNSDLVQGFAAWAVEGLSRVYAEGDVYRAEVCRAATREFWASVDPLRDFWVAQDVAELVLGVETARLRRRYEAWCQEFGLKPLGAKNFGKACKSVGLEQIKSGVVRWKLTNRGRFPDHEGLGTMGITNPIPPKLEQFTYTGQRSDGFLENAPNSAHHAQLMGGKISENDEA